MRTVIPILATGLAAVLTLTLSGCFGDKPSYTPAAEPTAAPLFATDEEALAAAEDAYWAFLDMSDQILNEGGADGERIRQVASPALAEVEMNGYKEAQSQGLQSVGSTNFDSAMLQQFDPRSDSGADIVSAYFCTDRSNVDVLDPAGVSIVQPERADRKAHEVFFDRSDQAPSKLIVSGIEQWAGDGICG